MNIVESDISYNSYGEVRDRKHYQYIENLNIHTV